MLFFAGLVGGTMNALAGGGSGVTFAALVVSGMPPIIANATNTFAATLGYITGALGYRNHLTAVRRDLVWQVLLRLWAVCWGAGCYCEQMRRYFLPPCRGCSYSRHCCSCWAASLSALRRAPARATLDYRRAGAFLTCIYGGYFNGGFGILTLAALSLAGYTQVRTMQGLKLIFATVSSFRRWSCLSARAWLIMSAGLR